MRSSAFPLWMPVRQNFPRTRPIDIGQALEREFTRVAARIPAGARIGVAVGSRGIAHLEAIVGTVLRQITAAGGRPFIIPAMGSHGGATPEGQSELLAEYGVSEARLGAPIHASLEVERVGRTDDQVEVFASTEARRADGVVLINRVKPHTDFRGAIGSGLLKLLVVGLGKHAGAAAFHAAASQRGYEHSIRTIARVLMNSLPILGGVAIIENQFHDTARITVLDPGKIERREEELFAEARGLMPRLPFDEVDLLIIDRIGKNISGSGIDPNIVGRAVHGYSSFLGEPNPAAPVIRRIFVRELTPETRGNAIGIGLADFTTTRLVRAIDKKATYINALTSLTPNGAKIPIHFETDREIIAHALATLPGVKPGAARMVRIADTLSLERLEVSEAYSPEIARQALLTVAGPVAEPQFDSDGNLAPLWANAIC